MIKHNTNIIISGGGTGGHLFPALALGSEIEKINSKINVHYVGSVHGIEKEAFMKRNLTYTLLPISGLHRQINFASAYKNMLLPYRIVRSKKIVQKLFTNINPRLVIATGGYASAIPLDEGIRRNIPTIIQEQNAFPGITTRWFAKKTSKVFIAFKEAEKFIEKKCILSGNPVRGELNKSNRDEAIEKLSLKNDKKTIFVFGGSQGSLFLNHLISKIVDELYNLDIQLIWQTGPKLYEKFKNHKNDLVTIIPFIENMADAYAACDIVISRSGAITCSEITYCGKPSILFPYLAAAGDHQTSNANFLAKEGASILLNEKTSNDSDLINSIKDLIHSKDRLNKMSKASLSLSLPNAVNKISKEAIALINNV